MAKRLEQFTNEQIEILLKNPNVADATTNTIKFTPEFKKLALQKTEECMSPNDIFKEAGFDLKIIGKKTPNNRIRACNFFRNSFSAFKYLFSSRILFKALFFLTSFAKYLVLFLLRVFSL